MKARRVAVCRRASLLAIDPGLGGTGWAVFNADSPHPARVGVIPARYRDESWWTRANMLADDVREAVWAFPGDIPSAIVCEMPQQMSSAAGIAAQKDANIYKLAFMVGIFSRWAYREGQRFTPVHPQQWKGQLPKGVVTNRIQRELGLKQCRVLGIKTHAWDAVGIGLWARGCKEFF